jgi:hypothetical protein
MDTKSFNRELERIFHSLEFEESGAIQISAAEWSSNELILRLSIRTGNLDDFEEWICTARGIRKESLTRDFDAESVQIHENHPLAWEYNNYESELYFGSAPKDPHKFITRLLEVHENATGGWIPLDQYINYGHLSLLQLCSSSSALFAKGPISLLKIYLELMEDFEMRPRLIGEYEPTILIDGEYVAETNLKEVLIMGSSYVIAEEFEFDKK